MRQLTSEEKVFTNKGIIKREEEIIDLTERLTMINAQKEFIVARRKYHQLVKPFNEKLEDKEIENSLKIIESDLRIAEKDLENLNKQLIEGVEEKGSVTYI